MLLEEVEVLKLGIPHTVAVAVAVELLQSDLSKVYLQQYLGQ
jgi:hypothetical protein